MSSTTVITTASRATARKSPDLFLTRATESILDSDSRTIGVIATISPERESVPRRHLYRDTILRLLHRNPIHDFPTPPGTDLEASVSEVTGHHVVRHTTQFFGICKDCVARSMRPVEPRYARTRKPVRTAQR